MKKLQYTLIELLAAMSIFIIMMGILFKTFTTSADVAASQSTKVSILQDANVFFNFLNNDLKNIEIEAIEKILNNQNAATDPNEDAASVEADGNKLHFSLTAPVSISFKSGVTPYYDRENGNYNGYDLIDELDITGSDGIPDEKPYVAYEYIASEKVIVRKMYPYQTDYVDNSNNYSGTTGSLSDDIPVILEGVEDFTIQVWEDYPGGTEITTSPIGVAPACVTFTVTLADPSPTMAQTMKDRTKRTITKVVYMQ